MTMKVRYNLFNRDFNIYNIVFNIYQNENRDETYNCREFCIYNVFALKKNLYYLSLFTFNFINP